MKVSKSLRYNVIMILFPIVTILLLCPLEILAGNERDFKFGINDFFWYFLLTAIVLLIVAVIIFHIIPKKLVVIISRISFAIGLMFYLQNMFLNKNIANDDGSFIDYSQYAVRNCLNMDIWFLVIIGVLVFAHKYKKFKKISLYVASFIITIEAVAIVSLLFTTRYNGELENTYVIDSSKQYQVGSKENVIIFVLDKYGNGRFDKLYEEDDSLADCLHDFTYFNNMNTTYAYTDPSLTYVLTNYDMSDINKDEYILDSAWQSANTKQRFENIKNAGYEVDLYTQGYNHIVNNGKYLNGIIDNQLVVDCDVDYFMLYRLLLKTSLYKCVPDILKESLQVQTFKYEGVVRYQERACDYFNIDYYTGLKDSGLSIDNNCDKKFIVEHISGTHEPFSIDENGNEINIEDPDRYEEGITTTQKGLMVILDTYFEELKRLGLYDSSTIIVMSDHGYKLDQYDPQPIFFIKASYESSDKMKVNSAPVSSEDVMPTVLQFMGIENDFQHGKTIYDWYEGDRRLRKCAYPENDYVPYEYDGDKQVLIELIKK